MNLQGLPSPAQLRALADYIEAMEGINPAALKCSTLKITRRKTRKKNDVLDELAKDIVRKKFFQK